MHQLLVSYGVANFARAVHGGLVSSSQVSLAIAIVSLALPSLDMLSSPTKPRLGDISFSSQFSLWDSFLCLPGTFFPSSIRSRRQYYIWNAKLIVIVIEILYDLLNFYQYEGAYLTDGKGLNTWDVFTHDSPGEVIELLF